MVDRAAEIAEAEVKTNNFFNYLRDLQAERDSLKGDAVAGSLGDLVAITKRLARVNAEIEAGRGVYQAAKAAVIELRRRDRFYQEKEAKRARRNQQE